MPQPEHVHSRTDSGRRFSRRPQPEHVLLLANHRSATITTPAREIGRELVLGIIADVAAAGRQPRQLRLGFAAIGRAFLLAAQAVRQAPRRLSNALCGLGPTLTSPVESAAQADTPKSTPTPPWFSAKAWPS